MEKIKWGIPMILLVLGIGASFLFKGKDSGEEESEENEVKETKTPRNVADDERRKIMSEMGKKGAAKSAEVRRAKKKAKKNEEE